MWWPHERYHPPCQHAAGPQFGTPNDKAADPFQGVGRYQNRDRGEHSRVARAPGCSDTRRSARKSALTGWRLVEMKHVLNINTKLIRHTGPHALCAGTDVSETRDYDTLSGSGVSGTCWPPAGLKPSDDRSAHAAPTCPVMTIARGADLCHGVHGENRGSTNCRQRGMPQPIDVGGDARVWRAGLRSPRGSPDTRERTADLSASTPGTLVPPPGPVWGC
jgi:hypothetical protein